MSRFVDGGTQLSGRLIEVLAWRAAAGLLALVAALHVVFVLAELAPGDFLSQYRLGGGAAQAGLEAEAARLGLDEGLAGRYLDWLRGLTRGRLGESLLYSQPVETVVGGRAGRSLGAVALALPLAFAIGIALALAGWRGPQSWRARVAEPVVSLLTALPEIVLALAVVALSVVIPVFARSSGVLWWTVLCLGLCGVPLVARQSRVILDQLSTERFVRTARAMGLSEAEVLRRHILPAVVGRLATLAAAVLTLLMGASVVVESVLGWPGLGPLAVDAVQARDSALLAGVVLVHVTVGVLGTLGADLVTAIGDPRGIRSSGTPRREESGRGGE